MKNVIVGQSGGPTSVINASLLGVFKTAKDRGADIVYGMVHGIKGLLDRDVVDLSTQIKNDLDMDLLKRTPSSFLGSCRYKLPAIEGNEKTYERIFLYRRQRFYGYHRQAVAVRQKDRQFDSFYGLSQDYRQRPCHYRPYARLRLGG